MIVSCDTTMQSPLTGSPLSVVVGGFGPPSGAARGLTTLSSAGGWAAPPVKLDSPAFLARHPRRNRLYAIAADHDRVVEIETDDAGAPLRPVAALPTGRRPAHITVSPDGRMVVVSCYGDGSVDAYSVGPGGELVARLDSPTAPPGSRAHNAAFLTGGGFLTTDLGLDLVVRWKAGRESIEVIGTSPVPRGSGPRHLALGDDGAVHVVTEYSVEVLSLRGDDLRLTSATPALAAGHRVGDSGAHLSLHGSRAYATVRGSNRVAVLRVDPGGRLEPLGDVDSGGDRPRHHALLPDGLLVANEASHDVVGFQLDPDGMPVPSGARWSTPSPTCLLPLT